MARPLVHVEGQTEEAFVNELLRNHLAAEGYYSVEARIVGNARQRARRGIRAWLSVRKDIVNHLREDPGCIATTMVDFYGMPQTWPGRQRAKSMGSVEQSARCVENAVKDDVVSEMGSRFDSGRFLAFVVMHEFEGLLFSDCAAFSRAIYRPELELGHQQIRNGFRSPE
jgi:hypothetical protein